MFCCSEDSGSWTWALGDGGALTLPQSCSEMHLCLRLFLETLASHKSILISGDWVTCCSHLASGRSLMSGAHTVPVKNHTKMPRSEAINTKRIRATHVTNVYHTGGLLSAGYCASWKSDCHSPPQAPSVGPHCHDHSRPFIIWLYPP